VSSSDVADLAHVQTLSVWLAVLLIVVYLLPPQTHV
jgi:hypothetical protein